MFIVLLTFAENKALASQFMAGHNQWLQQGFDDGVFLLAGSLQPNLGGSIVAHQVTRSALEDRLRADPFVQQHVVTTEILEISPKKAEARLSFLLN